MKTNFFNGIFTTDNLPLTASELETLAAHWKMTLTSGAIHYVLGLMALSLPIHTTVSMNYAFGGIFLATGVVVFAQAYEFRHQRGSGIRFFQAILAFTLSTLMFQYPQSGMIGIALSLSFYFLSNAALKWAFFSVVRTHGGWNWGFISAITSFILYLITIFPFSSFWVARALLAIELVVTGTGLAGVALSVKKIHPPHSEALSQNRVRRRRVSRHRNF